MKTSNKLLIGFVSFLMVSILTLLTAARMNAKIRTEPSAENTKQEALQGNGRLGIQTRSIPNFSRLVLHSNMDVQLSSSIDSLELEAEDNIFEQIVTEVKDGQLQIHWKQGRWVERTLPIKIKIPLKVLSSIELKGNGFITSLDTIRNDSLRLESHGDGDLELPLEVNYLFVNISDDGDLELQGKAEQLEMMVHGSGDLEAPDLMVQNANINTYGRGGAKLQVENQIKAVLNGPGHIKFKGPATIDATINGSGRVIRKE